MLCYHYWEELTVHGRPALPLSEEVTHLNRGWGSLRRRPTGVITGGRRPTGGSLRPAGGGLAARGRGRRTAAGRRRPHGRRPADGGRREAEALRQPSGRAGGCGDALREAAARGRADARRVTGVGQEVGCAVMLGRLGRIQARKRFRSEVFGPFNRGYVDTPRICIRGVSVSDTYPIRDTVPRWSIHISQPAAMLACVWF